jgi:hypothetical protein
VQLNVSRIDRKQKFCIKDDQENKNQVLEKGRDEATIFQKQVNLG